MKIFYIYYYFDFYVFNYYVSFNLSLVNIICVANHLLDFSVGLSFLNYDKSLTYGKLKSRLVFLMIAYRTELNNTCAYL